MPEAVLVADHMFDIDGLVAGKHGTWTFMSAGGLDHPPYRSEQVNRPQQHGAFTLGPDYMEGRIVTMLIGTEGDYGSEAYQTKLDALSRVMRPRDEDMTLRFTYNGADARRVYCRPQRMQFTVDSDLRAGIAVVALEFFSQDPLIYADEESTLDLVPVSVSGGLGFEHGFPHGFGTSVFGANVASNFGVIGTYPYGTIDGVGDGVSSITLENLTTGKVWTIDGDLSAGSTLTFDFKAQTVVMNGTASRGNLVQYPESSWWAVEPGDNEISLRTTPINSGSCELTFNYRSAYLIV